MVSNAGYDHLASNEVGLNHDLKSQLDCGIEDRCDVEGMSLPHDMVDGPRG